MADNRRKSVNNDSNQKSSRLMMKSRRRLLVAFVVIMVLMLALVVRLIYITATSGDKYSRVVLDQQSYTSRILPYKRGDILDRNGTVIATSEKVYNLILDVYVMSNSRIYEEGDCIDPTLDVLTEYFKIKRSDLDEIVEKNPESRYQILRKQLPYSIVNEYTEFLESDDERVRYIKGVWFEEEYLRVYPYDSLASHVIGFTNAGNAGAYGIEEYYNSTLNGTDGREYMYFDDTIENTTVSAVNGYNVVSTIDINIQRIVESALKEFNDRVGAKNSAIIVCDPNNGEILAMAQYPAYDLNNPRSLDGIYKKEELEDLDEDELIELSVKVWRNFCISDTFEPGSTTKTMTVAAALDEGVVSPEDEYFCDGGEEISGIYVGCVNRYGHGEQDLMHAVMNSCNDALMSIGLKLGAEKFSEYQHACGYGQRTGIDLPGEESGEWLLYSAEDMKPIDLATNSFGQNYSVTMI
ncbi:MAG: peptidoglycan glycosyltransferase, partial [Lachnospiraceae bacterium]|nr:peptidoglycan glycosyltransferase [Lachnospiraceae bacterium]